MATRVTPSERLRRELDEKLAGIDGSEDPVEEVARLGARLVLQQALEDEVTEFLGRERYERRGEPVAYRNGYEPTTVRATAGPIALERPRLRSAGGFASSRGSSAAASPAPTPWRRSRSAPSCAGSRPATSRPPSRRSSTSR